jgi:hypothetical protein
MEPRKKSCSISPLLLERSVTKRVRGAAKNPATFPPLLLELSVTKRVPGAAKTGNISPYTVRQLAVEVSGGRFSLRSALPNPYTPARPFGAPRRGSNLPPPRDDPKPNPRQAPNSARHFLTTTI